MANTSPRHMPVLGNVHPIKIYFYIFNRYGYPRGSHEKYLKEIVDPVFDIYAIELLGSMSTDEAWRHLRTLNCIRSTLTYREYVCKSLQWFIEYYNSYGLSKIANITIL